MKNLVKRLVGIAAAFAIIVTTAAGAGITAQAATVTGYTWESTSDGGESWGTVPEAMRKAVASLDYDAEAGTFEITTAGTVFIYGVLGYVSEVYATDASGNKIGNQLLQGNTAVITEVTGEPVYVYYKVALLGGLFHREVSSKYTDLVY